MSSLKDLYTDYTVASSQGVVAIVWDDILQAIDEGQIPLEQQPTKAERIRWALATEQIECKYARQKALIA